MISHPTNEVPAIRPISPASALLCGLALLPGCKPSAFLRPPWQEGEVGVVGLADQSGAAIEATVTLSRGGAPIQLEVDRGGSVRLWAQSFGPSDVDFDRCALHVEHEASKILRANEAWLSDALSASDPEASWSPATLTFGVGAECPPVDDRCTSGTVERYSFGESPVDHFALAAVSDDAVWLLGAGVEGDDRTTLSLFDGTGRHDQPKTEVSGHGRALVLEGDVLYGATDIGWIFRRDLRTGTSSIGRIDTFLNGMWRTKDGLWFAQVGREPRFVELLGGDSSAPLSGYPAKSRTLVAISATEMISGDGFGLILRFDGQLWRPEHDAGAFAEFSASATNGQRTLLTTRYSDYWLSDLPGQWSSIPHPEVTFPAAAAMFSGGRAIVVGAAGGIGLLLDGHFCRLEGPTTAPLWGVSVAPSGRVAWVVGQRSTPDGEPTLLRVRVP